MKYAIISDIHSNIHAFKAALKEIEPVVDEIICLGDVVGYNAKPRECIRLMKNHHMITHVVQGNHDTDSADFKFMNMSRFREMSQDAYDGIKYSDSCLTDEDRKWLEGLPNECLIEDDDAPFWISHYSPEKCTGWGYILGIWEAKESLKVLKSWGGSNIFFFGHSHVPTYIEETNGEVKFDLGAHLNGDTYVINDSSTYLINPGSIGQPRDQGLTSYAIFDTEEKTIKIQGFEYNIKAAQKAIRLAGYSDRIANRLDFEHDKKIKEAKKAKWKREQKQADAKKVHEIKDKLTEKDVLKGDKE